jgi:hypothetical protein
MTCSLTHKHRSVKTGTDIKNNNIQINYISATFMLVMMMSFPRANQTMSDNAVTGRHNSEARNA